MANTSNTQLILILSNIVRDELARGLSICDYDTIRNASTAILLLQLAQ